MPLAGVDGTVLASTIWDPDGAGPLKPRIVISGRFRTAGDVACSGVAMFDSEAGHWLPLGTLPTGASTDVLALAVLPTGQLVAGGNYLTANWNCVVVWDGTAWQPLDGSGSSGRVSKLKAASNGDLIASGTFTSIGGIAATRIARWDGSTWAALGAGLSSEPSTMEVMSNGDLVVGGSFFQLGGIGNTSIARWDGAAWSTVGGGISPQDGLVNRLLPLANGDLLVCGSFPSVGGGAVLANNVARWDGSTWSPFGTGTDSWVTDATELPNGELVCVGHFSYAGGVAAPGIAAWNGSFWSNHYPALGSYGATLNTTLTSPTGTLVVGGDFHGNGVVNIAEWSGQTWRSLAGGIDGIVQATVGLRDGGAVVGGSFQVIDGVAANNIARWDGNSWQPIGTGMNGAVTSLAVGADGRIFAGGVFTIAGSMVASHVAMWDGVQWQRLAGGITTSYPISGSTFVESMVVAANGDLVVCGGFDTVDFMPATGVARWDGTTWQALDLPVATHARVLAERNGVLYLGEDNAVRQWSGSAWTYVGLSFTGSVKSLAWLPDGELLAGGAFTQAGGVPVEGVARWNGTLWWPIGVGAPRAASMLSLPNGDLVAAGDTGSPGSIRHGLYRWNGSAWSQLSGAFNATYESLSIAVLTSGELMVGGDFTRQDAEAQLYLARFATTCPATVTSFGAGCPGSGGITQLNSTSPAWLGATHGVKASGMPANGIGLVLRGLLTTNVPLSALLPMAGANCALLVDPAFVQVVLPQAGSAASAITIPNDPIFAGLALHEQVTALDLDAAGTLVDATTSNRLTVILGVF